MEAIELNQLNSTFQVHGSEDKRSLEIKAIEVKEWPKAGRVLKLVVFDEKDVPIYSRQLQSFQPESTGTVTINQRFVFYDHISVRLEADTEGSIYSAIVKFE